MKKQFALLFPISLFSLILFTGCGNTKIAITATVYPGPVSNTTEYPVPDNNPSIYPGPITTSAIPTAASPQVSSSLGALKIILISSFTNKPLVDANIRCASMLKGTGPLPDAYLPDLDMKKSPWGNTDEHGTLVISNITPGKYALVYMTPTGNPELMKIQGTDKNIVFDIQAGKTTDLVTVNVNIDPSKP